MWFLNTYRSIFLETDLGKKNPAPFFLKLVGTVQNLWVQCELYDAVFSMIKTRHVVSIYISLYIFLETDLGKKTQLHSS